MCKPGLLTDVAIKRKERLTSPSGVDFDDLDYGFKEEDKDYDKVTIL